MAVLKGTEKPNIHERAKKLRIKGILDISLNMSYLSNYWTWCRIITFQLHGDGDGDGDGDGVVDGIKVRTPLVFIPVRLWTHRSVHRKSVPTREEQKEQSKSQRWGKSFSWNFLLSTSTSALSFHYPLQLLFGNPSPSTSLTFPPNSVHLFFCFSRKNVAYN